MAPKATRRRVVVVGGGFAGLAAARSHAAAGADVTVLEASARVGGRLAPVSLAGIEVDAGAESFATRGGTVQALVEQLGLADRVVEPLAAPAWVVSAAGSYALPSTSWLGIPSRPLSREVRAVLGWRGALRAALDLVTPPSAAREGQTLGEVARRRLGRAATDRLVAPVVTGVYTREVDQIELDTMAPGLAADVARRGLIRTARARRAAAPPGSAVRSIEGGLFRLADALADDARAQGAQIRTGVAVTGVERDGEAWRVDTADGPLSADAVVVAVPRDAAATLVGLAPASSPAKVVAIAVLVVDAPALDGVPRGTGVLVRPGVTRAKALTHASAKWPWIARQLPAGRHVIRLSYDVEAAGDDVLAHALADASTLLGVELTPESLVASSVHLWPDAAPSTLDAGDLPEGLHLVGSAAGLTGLAAITAALARADFS